MATYQLDAALKSSENAIGQIAGKPSLPVGEPWPCCQRCGVEMVAYLDLILPLESSPFQTGSRLQLFGCRQHNEIAGPIYSDYSPFVKASHGLQLPDNYWEMTDGHYCLRLLAPSELLVESRWEASLIFQHIVATVISDDGADGFKLFGSPYWLQDAEEHICCCGATMKLLLQIPENYAFPKAESAEVQPDSFSHSDYCLFLGNQLYLFAVSARRTTVRFVLLVWFGRWSSGGRSLL